MSQADLVVIGKIIEIGHPTINGEYQKIKFTIHVSFGNEAYPDYAVFEVGNKIGAEYDNVGNLTKFNKVGDEVTVNFNLEGFGWAKEGPKKYYNNLKAWRVSKYEGAPVENDFDEQMEEDPFA